MHLARLEVPNNDILDRMCFFYHCNNLLAALDHLVCGGAVLFHRYHTPLETQREARLPTPLESVLGDVHRHPTPFSARHSVDESTRARYFEPCKMHRQVLLEAESP